MSNVVNIQNFIKASNTASQSQKDWEALYFEHIEKMQHSPEYLQTTDKLFYLRNLIISMGIDEKLVDTLIEATMEKTASECEVFDSTIIDAFFSQNRG